MCWQAAVGADNQGARFLSRHTAGRKLPNSMSAAYEPTK
jgi:hypothetical protein